MIVRSLGYRTDLIFARFDGVVIDRGEYLVVRTPSNPTFYWGNFLLFTAPPAPGDFDRWRSLFAQEIGPPSRVSHMAFGWDTVDGESGDVAPFVEAGFSLDVGVVLTAQSVTRPVKFNEDVLVRELTEDWEWDAAFDNQMACRDEDHEEAGYRVYASRRLARCRAMARAGLGSHYGAFLGNRLVGDLGIFVDDGMGRFQMVGVHPDFRRRGICGAMVYQAATQVFERGNAHTLAIVANANYHAAHIYHSTGFVPTERQVGVTWWERPRG